MVIMYKMTPEKKEKFAHKIEKMMDFLEEFKDCLEESEVSEEPEYRGGNYRSGSYRKDWDDEEMNIRGGRYRYRVGSR